MELRGFLDLDDRPAEGKAKEHYSTAVLNTITVTGSLFYRLLPAVTYSVSHYVELGPFSSPVGITLSKSLSQAKSGSAENILREKLHLNTYSHFFLFKPPVCSLRLHFSALNTCI